VNIQKEIIKTWSGNRNGSIVLTIPVSISKQYGLDEPTYAILETRNDRILIHKLEEKTVEVPAG
jgi:hypothetical protein